MTPEELQELRDWAARKMGWEEYIHLKSADSELLCVPTWSDGEKYGIPKSKWQPDNPATGQIWTLVERMRELGWLLNLQTFSECYVAYFEPLDRPATELGTQYKAKIIQDTNPARAIIKAARVTREP